MGCLSVLVILIRLIAPPEIPTVAASSVEVETGVKLGVLLGLLSAFVMTAGGYFALQDE